MMNRTISNNKHGFTLIELLIVIVILGILSGVVLTVINPTKQQERARAAVVRATVEKACMALHTCAESNLVDTNCDTWAEIGSADLPAVRNGSYGNGEYSISIVGGQITVAGNYLQANGTTECSFSCRGDPSTGALTNMTSELEGICDVPI